ncbi:MAG: oligosaccharide flippase family protein [Sulfurovaceae bacterium]|nr:oligosaccharide flippase family protein [Sulfurovaceae bacterium]
MNFFKSLSIYTLTSILNSAVPFLLLPILTNYLTTEEYGLLAIIQIFIIFTIPFVSINIHSTLQLEYYELNKDEFALWISSILVIPIGMIFVVSLFFIISESLIYHFINISLLWILIIPLIAFMQVVPQTILSIYRISEKAIDYAKYQLGLTIFNLILTLILVVMLNLNWEGRLLAILLSYIVFTFLGIYLLIKMELIVFKVKKSYIKKALHLGIPLILHVVSGALFMMSDRLFISYYIGNDAVGIYAVGGQIAMIALIIQEAFNQAWVPYLFKNLKIGLIENKIEIIKISYLAILFFSILPFLIELVSPLFFKFFIDTKFIDAMQYVFWIALGYSLLGMYKVVTNYIFYEKRVKILSAMTFLSLMINLVLNYILIKKYGAIGVAYGTAITVSIFFVIAFIIANKVYKMPWLFFLEKKR